MKVGERQALEAIVLDDASHSLCGRPFGPQVSPRRGAPLPIARTPGIDSPTKVHGDPSLRGVNAGGFGKDYGLEAFNRGDLKSVVVRGFDV